METVIQQCAGEFTETEPMVEKTTCPACGAAMIELRGFFRCGRCAFSICADCDSGGYAE
jgi:transposase